MQKEGRALDTSTNIHAAVKVLKQGKPIVFPTDTVVGLGVAVNYASSPVEIAHIKGRDEQKPIAWLVAGPEALDTYGKNVPAYAYELAREGWPGALTLVVEASEEVPEAYRSDAGTIGLRVSASHVVRALIDQVGPLATSSANAAGDMPACKVSDINKALAEQVGYILDDESEGTGCASRVADCTGSKAQELRSSKEPLHENKSVPKQGKEHSMIISIGADHGGFEQKEQLRAYLEGEGHNVIDRGCFTDERCDYPDFAEPVARDVAGGQADYGVLVCGTGIGMALAADKVPGVRAANITRVDFAELARQHNNANVVTLSGRFVDIETNKHILDTFLHTEFEGGRHVARVAKIMDLD